MKILLGDRLVQSFRAVNRGRLDPALTVWFPASLAASNRSSDATNFGLSMDGMSTKQLEPEKTARYQRRRESVLAAAVELFSKNGYAGTGVADIGEATKLGRGTLYYYIGSKESLLAEIHDRVMDPLLMEASEIVQLDLSFQVRLRLLSESLLWQILNRKDYVWVFLHEYHQLTGRFRDSFREKRKRFEGYIRQVLSEGAEQQALRHENLQLMTLAFLNLHNYTYTWAATREDLKTDELSQFFCAIFLNGILKEPVDDAGLESELESGRAALRTLRAGGLPQP